MYINEEECGENWLFGLLTDRQTFFPSRRYRQPKNQYQLSLYAPERQ
jgi:hypothetical protein